MISSKIINKKVGTHALFWLILYGYYVSSNWSFFENKLALVEKYAIKTGLLMGLSYTIIYIFIPLFLKKGQKFLFLLASLFAVYLIYVIYTCIRFFYFDPKFSDVYKPFKLYERITDFAFYFSELYWFLFPPIILMAIKYYKDQEEIVTLRAEKKGLELNQLKNQLNPHFLFNTLNNLYTLSLKKSDRAPEVILKLSKILDYLLYKCQDNFVPISGEVQLLNYYIDLEKVRYGKRLNLNFKTKIEEDVNIAPLLLLTFVENAFKHGVSQEIKVANIDISVQATKKQIEFKITNTKPKNATTISAEKRANIGLLNIKKQLDILYADKAVLTTADMETTYSVHLKIMPNAL